ncbi:MAG: hypothetical protein ACRC1L_04205, partial [Prochlorococcaceae cyanobacterium]
EQLLVALEAFYGRFGDSGGAGGGARGEASDEASDERTSCDGRIDALRERVLRLAEIRLGVRAAGTAADRCRRLEEVAWPWIHREDLPPRHQLAPLQRGLADQAAAEAALALRHMRLGETFVAVSAGYLDAPSFERCADVALLLHDGLARLGGGALPARPRLGRRHARLQVAEPIAVPAEPGGRGQLDTLNALLEERLRGCLP